MAATATATANSSLFSAPMQMSFLVMPQMVAVQFDALPCRRFLSKKIHDVKLCPALVTLAFKKQSTHVYFLSSGACLSGVYMQALTVLVARNILTV